MMAVVTGGLEQASREERIESLLSARLFVEPQLAGDRLVFVSSLAGQLSLYSMDVGGSVPDPLLPPGIALQNPELVGGYSFHVDPRGNRVVVMIDSDGDENYVPYVVPLSGGFPQALAPGTFAGRRSHLVDFDPKTSIAYFAAESREESLTTAFRVDLESGEVDTIGESAYGAFVAAWSPDHERAILADGYTVGDVVLYEPDGNGGRQVLYGTLLEDRVEGTDYPPHGVRSPHYVESGNGLLLVSSLVDDTGSFGFLAFDRPGEIEPVAVAGTRHEGVGELEGMAHLDGNRYELRFNIDGCSWAYEARFDEPGRKLTVERALVGEGELAGGVLHGLHYEEESGRFALSFCTATMPTQLFVLGTGSAPPARKTDEKPLGLAPASLSPGEDASFESHDGLRVSARLYLPAEELGYEGTRPLVYYVHGGPQSQERPNFAWFSMPLIQILTLEGFAVFVPNARGSSGYGLSYTKRVDRDWGGLDMLDHVHALTEVLPKDERVDTERAGVVGRSYGGYMTLMLAGRYPHLWRAAVDMFGPYDLLTFSERIPETWKPYFALALGDPEQDRDFLVERSPKTTIAGLTAPLLVIQGQNDPRVVERESHDLVEALRAQGKDVDYLVFSDEGHDVLKLPNRVRCYDAIVGFFSEHLS
jgi:dipeptidyl aminopeptidase/acylaminoacyl peptidase